MRKFIVCLMTVALVITTTLIFNFHFGREKYSESDVIEFSENVKTLSDKYDTYEGEMHNNSVLKNPDLNRLIIKSDHSITSDTAVDGFYGVGYQVFQYKDNNSMESDYNLFFSRGYDVHKDRVLSITDRVDYEYLPDISQQNMWSYEHLNVEYTKALCRDCDNQIVVGVMDTGVEYTHEMLSDRIISTDLNFSTSGNENDALDDNGHGTAVSGVIVNSTPDNVKIKPYKILSAGGNCTELNVVSACEYILAQTDKPDIVNMSFGGYNFDNNSIERDVCDRLVDAGITVVIASGNDTLDVKYVTPADSEKAIIAGAYGEDLKPCYFSNYGDGIDIAAPGFSIYTSYRDNGYVCLEGTSFSAPFVSAGCAYIKMLNPDFTVDEIKEKLYSDCVYMGSDEEIYFGNGMLNLVNIVTPDNISATASLSDGVYHSPQQLSFDNIPDGATLIYTTDSTVPTCENSEVYADELYLENDIHINYALVDENGYYISDVKTCNYEVRYYASDADFEINENGSIILYKGEHNDVVVPDVINGITPVEVAYNAFSDSQVVRVTLPDSVIRINNGFANNKTLKHIVAKGVKRLSGAFYECENLRDEVMPNVTSSSSSFYDCYRLREIDFADSLEKIGTENFTATALTHLDLPKVTHLMGCRDAFSYSKLISIKLPAVTNICESEFNSCDFLQNVYAPKATNLGSSCFSMCSMLKEFEASSVTTLSPNALRESYINVFDAPNVTQLLSGTRYFEDSRNKVIRLSGLTGQLGKKNFDYSGVESIYLDNVTSMSEGFSYNYNLKLLYMPECTDFIDTGVTSNIYHGPVNPPIQVLWLPSCKELTYQCVNLRLLFAPSLESLDISKVKNASLFLGNNLQSINADITEGYDCRIYAPESSYALQYADSNSISYVANESSIDVLTSDTASASFNISNEIFDFSLLNYAKNIEYGYFYEYEACLSENAEKVNVDFSRNSESNPIYVSYSTLPDVNENDYISLRAFMIIDGVSFMSTEISSVVNFNNSCLSGHSRVVFKAVQERNFYYTCTDCNTVICKSPDELLAMWDNRYLNKRTTDSNNSGLCYFEIVNDGCINGKDISMIYKMQKNKV